MRRWLVALMLLVPSLAWAATDKGAVFTGSVAPAPTSTFYAGLMAGTTQATRWAIFDWRWGAALIAGSLPSIVGGTPGGASHRQQFMLLPLAALAGHCPPRLTLAVAIALCGLMAWHDPAFWQAWKGAAIHAF